MCHGQLRLRPDGTKEALSSVSFQYPEYFISQQGTFVISCCSCSLRELEPAVFAAVGMDMAMDMGVSRRRLLVLVVVINFIIQRPVHTSSASF